jgi:PAS domain S-box-containing protein
VAVARAISKLEKGETDIEVTGQSGQALDKLKSTLARLREGEHRRVWAVQGLATLAEIRNQEGDLTTYSFQVVNTLVKYVKANQGAFYLLHEDNGSSFLLLKSAYAYGKRKYTDKEIRVDTGEGLLGQCVLEKDIIYMTDVPKDYVKITSGLGEATPRCVIILPLVFRGQVHGVIELAAFQPLEKFELEFLRKAAENIGAELYSIRNHEHTRKLLEQSQSLSSELRSQEEEIRQNMEEMQASQEEMARHQAELNGVFDSINQSMGAAEFSAAGEMISCNPTLQHYLGLTESQLKNERLDWMCGGIGLAEKVNAAMMTGKSHVEEYALSLNNNTIWLNATFNPVVDSKGALLKILMLAQDVTTIRLRTQEFNFKLESISQNNAIVEFDAQGRIAEVNDFFLKVTEFKKANLQGKLYDVLIPESERSKPQILVMWQNLLAGQSFTGEFSFVDAMGKEQWVSGTYNPIFDLQGRLYKIMMLGQFVTDNREKQQELKQYVNVLKQSFPLLEVNSQLQLKSCNDKFLALSKLKRMEFSRKSIHEVLTDDSIIDLAAIFKSNQDHEVLSIKLALRNGKDPQVFNSSISLVKSQSNQLLRAIIVLREEEFVNVGA